MNQQSRSSFCKKICCDAKKGIYHAVREDKKFLKEVIKALESAFNTRAEPITLYRGSAITHNISYFESRVLDR